jgi:superfamily II DNA or RNA helicase
MNLKEVGLKTEYRSLLDNVIKDFYIPVLRQSVLYKRAVGFFSSTALLELSLGICALVENGGKIQLIASPRLSQEDIEAIKDGLKRRDTIIEEALIRELHEPKSAFDEERLNLLSNLIATGVLEIKIAILETDNSVGMFHEKMGLMYDDGNNIIAFTGSMNESANAFMQNYEAIDVFTSWSSDEDRVLNKQAAFNAMWNDYEPNIRVLEFNRISQSIIEKYQRNKIIDTTLDINIIKENPSELYAVEKQGGPSIPEYINLRGYQKEAISNWSAHSYQGIFDMATGTGKTYTALSAVVDLYNAMNKKLAVIIVCPYQHLVEQWKDDIIKYGMKPIVCYSASSQKKWRERLKTSATSFTVGAQDHFCMITTNATFSTDYVQDIIMKLSGNIVLIVDEAHNFGAENLSKTLMPHIPFRLALSATLDRHGDPDGTQKLIRYFGDKCIEYSLKDAIDNDMLTPYHYHPIVVSLNEDELAQYLELTAKLRKSIHNAKNGKSQLSDYAKMLLITRARIVAGASQKIDMLREVIADYRNDNQILVYCGAATMRDFDYNENKAMGDEVRQIDIVTNMLGNDLGMRVTKFTSEEDNAERGRIKVDFSEGIHLQALVAIRCLDEGVNIPSIRTAFILASSTNPKEYIQRRGRVLRKSPGKNYATIFDFITLPVALEMVDQVDQEIIESAKSLAVREITRMKDFASIAENPFDSDSLISEIQSGYNIEIIDEEDESYVY